MTTTRITTLKMNYAHAAKAMAVTCGLTTFYRVPIAKRSRFHDRPHTQLRKLATEALLDHEIRHSFTIDHSGWSGAGDLIEAQEYIAAANPQAVIELLDEIERLKKDAERYSWLRKTTNWVSSGDKRIDVRNNPELWDAAIDAAISKMESTAVK